MLNVISGDMPIDSGSVLLDGKELNKLKNFKRAQRIGRVFQNPAMGTCPSMTIWENLSIADNKGKNFGFSFGLNRQRKDFYRSQLELLGMGLENRLSTLAGSLSALDNSAFFNDCDLNLVDWLAQFTPKIPEANTESFKRAFLGRMLFSGDDVFKPVKVLSGGEKVRCMLSRMMLYGSNVLVLDQPTNHLDLESITAVNNGLVDFKGVVLFSSHDHEFVQTIANRIMVLEDGKLTDRLGTYEDYIASMANTAE